MTYLLPCPFCGETPIVDNTENHSEAGGPDSWLVCCGSFACYGNAFTLDNTFHSREHACEAWNTRTPLTPEPDAAEEETWSCGHKGFPSIFPTDEGKVECTVCSNARKGFEGYAQMRDQLPVFPTTISEGARIVEKHRPEMNNLTAAEREEYYLRGMQMIYAKWWPIASAPKDGTHILMYRKSGVNEAWWRENIFKTAFEWGGAGWSYPENDQPTHWMSLPPAP